MKPLLAHTWTPSTSIPYPCWVQPKLNGIRALWSQGRFQSRDEVPFPVATLAHINAQLIDLLGPDADDPSIILDGELYVHRWSLQRINAAVTPVRIEPTADSLLVQFHIFDRAHTSSFDYRRELLEGLKWKILQNTVFRLGESIYPNLQIVSTVLCASAARADGVFCSFVEDGYEGLMYRLGDCPYTLPKEKKRPELVYSLARTPYGSDKDNRTHHLLKRKSWLDDEFICVGVLEGEGDAAGRVGAIKLRTKSGNLFKVGVFMGFTHTHLEDLLQTPPVGHKVKVKFLSLSEGGVPTNATVLSIL